VIYTTKAKGMRLFLLLSSIIAISLSFAGSAKAANTTIVDYFKNKEAPAFRPDHTLPSLSYYLGGGAELSRYVLNSAGTAYLKNFDAEKELAQRWGYGILHAYEHGQFPSERELFDFAKLSPKEYPIFVILDTRPWNLNYGSMARITPKNIFCRDQYGSLLFSGGSRMWCPEAQDAWYRFSMRYKTAALRDIAGKANISIILDQGETALWSWGTNQSELWKYDPRVLRAQGTRTNSIYYAERKNNEENSMVQALQEAVPDRQLLVYYQNGGGPLRGTQNWPLFYMDYDFIRGRSDIPSSGVYYKHGADGFVIPANRKDLLTLALNARGYEISKGDKLSYNWLCAGGCKGGQSSGEYLADIPTYIGYLKAYYTAGMIGGVAGWYDSARPQTCTDSILPLAGGKTSALCVMDFDQNSPRHWVQQIEMLSQAHAQFSWLEPFLRNGELLPGPDSHYFHSGQSYNSNDGQPAYEFPTGYANTRVLARKMNEQNKWIVTAWAADGVTRDVTVTIPVLGAVSVNAIAAGHVYYFDGSSANQYLLDGNNPMNPSQEIKTLYDQGILNIF